MSSSVMVRCALYLTNHSKCLMKEKQTVKTNLHNFVALELDSIMLYSVKWPSFGCEVSFLKDSNVTMPEMHVLCKIYWQVINHRSPWEIQASILERSRFFFTLISQDFETLKSHKTLLVIYETSTSWCHMASLASVLLISNLHRANFK